eukprot:TRINITY_DN110247_c0_g1_i1.p1 TRINITY_DN110247_c0_g1~~TRINITY_DN110247_c0_g1_i1.p1  ORF type:complete len:337 (-),score=66.81 TRINITY_DN110247_c0_g1_i1:244-1155(-)
MYKLDRNSIRQLIAQDPDYFLSKYKGQKIEYETQTKQETHQMFLDLAAIIDHDNDGVVDEKNFDEAADILRISKAAKQSNSAELNYKHLPKAVVDVLSQWDADKSGSVGVAELVKAGEAQKKIEQENRLVKKLLAVAGAIIVVLLVATFCLSFAAVELAKDSRPDEVGIQMLPNGSPVANAQAREVKKVLDWPSLPFDTLTRAESFNLVYDDKAHHLKIASLEQSVTSDLTIKTLDGRTVEISADGIIKVDGVVKQEAVPRRLRGCGSGKNLVMQAAGGARRLDFSGGLCTSGSFTMMSAGGA